MMKGGRQRRFRTSFQEVLHAEAMMRNVSSIFESFFMSQIRIAQ
jgi:hypothetical protein